MQGVSSRRHTWTSKRKYTSIIVRHVETREFTLVLMHALRSFQYCLVYVNISVIRVASLLWSFNLGVCLRNTFTPPTWTRQDCLVLSCISGVNRVCDKSRLSVTEHFETILSSLKMRRGLLKTVLTCRQFYSHHWNGLVLSMSVVWTTVIKVYVFVQFFYLYSVLFFFCLRAERSCSISYCMHALDGTPSGLPLSYHVHMFTTRN